MRPHTVNIVKAALLGFERKPLLGPLYFPDFAPIRFPRTHHHPQNVTGELRQDETRYSLAKRYALFGRRMGKRCLRYRGIDNIIVYY